MSELRTNQVVIANAIVGYPHLFQPYQFRGDNKDPDYSCWLILPANFDFTLFMAGIEDAENYKWGSQRPQGLVQPFKQVPDGPYAGYWYVSTKGFGNQPQVVDQNVQPLLQPDLIVSGSRVNAMVSVFAYDSMGNKGTSCRLHMVQLLETAGTPQLPALASDVKAEDVFQPVAGAPVPTAATPAPAGPAVPQAAPAPQAAPQAAPAPAPGPAPAPAAAPAPAPGPAVNPAITG